VKPFRLESCTFEKKRCAPLRNDACNFAQKQQASSAIVVW